MITPASSVFFKKDGGTDLAWDVTSLKDLPHHPLPLPSAALHPVYLPPNMSSETPHIDIVQL